MNSQFATEESNAHSPKPRVGKVIIYGWVSTWVSGTSALLISISSKFLWISIGLFILGTIGAAFAVRLGLINHRWKHRTATFWAFTPVPILLGLCIWVIAAQVAEQRAAAVRNTPHFQIMLQKAGTFIPAYLRLTNDFLLAKPATFSSVTNLIGTVVVAVDPKATTIPLLFALQQDNDALCDKAEVVISLPRWLIVDPADEFRDLPKYAEYPSANATTHFSIGRMLDLKRYLPGDEIPVPEFAILKPRQDAPNLHLVQVRVRATGANPVFCNFFLYFLQTTNDFRPELITNRLDTLPQALTRFEALHASK